ncbi:MAG TPA: NADH-quinone oxidoreductase subunit J [Pyrinomonadaceae bacterium]|jgi:NADH-quinone oxidoreductase subunit J
MLALLFFLFGGLAIGCAISMVVQRNPLYSAISLIGVFISLASLYIMLAAPFIAAVQVIVYAGAIMVLVVFVIMLLNVEEEERRRMRLGFLIPTAIALAAVLIAEAAFVFYSVQSGSQLQDPTTSDVGLTASIGRGLFTTYLLPFEITSILLLMAIVGAMTLARRAAIIGPQTRVVPGAQVLTKSITERKSIGDATEVETDSTIEAARLLRTDETRGARERE